MKQQRLSGISLLLALVCWPAPVLAVEYGQDQEPDRAAFVAGIHRDLEKIDRSLTVTKELIDKSSARPYLPDLRFRMAELYVEKSRLIFFLALEKAGQGSSAVVAPEARLLKEQAIALYEQVLQEFPRFEAADKVLFFMSHEHRELGRYDDMRRTLLRLIDTYPQSKFRHEARLVLGDHHFDAGELDAAADHYERILTEPESFAHQMARYKMAWIRINEEKMKEALALLRAVVTSEADASGSLTVDRQKLVSARREALLDMVFVYTEVKDAKLALDYFEPLATDKPEYLRVLERLGNRLFVQEKWMPAARVYRRLVDLSGDAERNIEYVTRIFTSAQQAKNLTGADKDSAALAQAMERYLLDWRFSEQERKDVEHDFELMARDVATRLQADALKMSNKSNLSVAADAYASYLRAFPKSSRGADMRANHAESLFAAGRFLEAAQVYAKISEALPEGDERRDMMYAAIVGYYKALEDVEQMGTYDVMLTREGLKGTGQRFVDAYPKSDKVANVRFNIAKLNYDQGHFPNSSALFAAFAEAYPSHADATAAGHLALDALDKLEDYEAMVTLGRRFVENTALDLAFRNEVQEIVKNASYKLVREVTVAAAVGDLSKHGQPGAEGEEMDSELLEYAKKHGGTKLGEVALLNAFALYQEKGNLNLMETAASRFLSDYPDSPKVRDIYLAQAKTFLSVGRFARAAALFEVVARTHPNDMASIDLLRRSARLYAALGEHRLAVDAWKTALPKLSRSERPEAIRAIITALVTLEDWRGLEQSVKELKSYGKAVFKGPEVALKLGLAAMRQRDPKGARKHLKQAAKDDDEVGAEARFRLLELDLEEYEAIRFEPGKDPGLVVAAKLELLDKMEDDLFTIFEYGSPQWSIAALLRVGQANERLAEFLAEVPPPPGLNPTQIAQYKQAIGQQVVAIRQKAYDTYAACAAKAYELDAFNRYLRGCLNQGKLPPPDRRPGRVHLGPAQESQRKRIESRLAQNPKEREALLELAGLYMKSGDMRMARILAGRVLDTDAGDGPAQNLVGLATLLLGDPSNAIFDLQQAAMTGGGQAPVVNLATLYWMYGDVERARNELKKLKDTRAIDFAAAGLHPQARKMAGALGVR